VSSRLSTRSACSQRSSQDQWVEYKVSALPHSKDAIAFVFCSAVVNGMSWYNSSSCSRHSHYISVSPSSKVSIDFLVFWDFSSDGWNFISNSRKSVVSCYILALWLLTKAIGGENELTWLCILSATWFLVDISLFESGVRLLNKE
jgi:hypothetical protein